MALVDLVKSLTSDPKSPDPVVPPDLHLTRSVGADPDGNVACLYCGTRTPFARAILIGSDGFACGQCQRPAVPATDASLSLRPRRWPWLLAIGGGLALVVALVAAGGTREPPPAPDDPYGAALRFAAAHEDELARAVAAPAGPDDGELAAGEKVLPLGIRRDPAVFYAVFDGDVYTQARGAQGQGVTVSSDRADWTKLRETGVIEDRAYLYYLDQDGDLARRPRL